MKHVIQVVARIIVAYFILLPLLFAIHTEDHSHDAIQSTGDGIEYAESDCQLCDLYYDQVAEKEQVAGFFVELLQQTFLIQPVNNPVDHSIDLLHLRGPPLA